VVAVAESVKKDNPYTDFWNPKADVEDLITQQGVKPISNVDELYGDFWPEDENIEDFLAALREWRSEGSRGIS
jgi:hypothetical protein